MARRKSPSNQLTLDGQATHDGDAAIPTRTLVEEVEAAFLEYSMSVIVAPRAPRRPRRSEARAAAHSLGYARRQSPPGPSVREVRACRR